MTGGNLLGTTSVRIRVIYADTDAMGVVYHTNYIRWFEIGRTELLRNMGIVYAEVEKSGYNLPLTQVYCHYRYPVHYDQIVVLETELEYLKKVSMKFTYKLWDENRLSVLTDGYSVHACTDRNGNIARIPSMISEMVNLSSNKIRGAKTNS